MLMMSVKTGSLWSIASVTLNWIWTWRCRQNKTRSGVHVVVVVMLVVVVGDSLAALPLQLSWWW